MTPQLISQQIANNSICPPGASKIRLNDPTLKGLHLEVRVTGGKTYYLTYRALNKPHVHRIGDASVVDLKTARAIAKKLHSEIAKGNFPHLVKAAALAQAQTQAQYPTFEEFATEQYMPHARMHKRSHSTDLAWLTNHILPSFGHKRIDQIKRDDIADLQHRMNQAGYAPASNNRVLVLVRFMFNLAVQWGVASITQNPSATVKLLPVNNSKERHLNDQEVQRLVQATLQSSNSMMRYIVPLLLLTGVRKSELLNAKWVDLDLTQQSLYLAQTKSGKPRFVTLSDQAIHVIQAIQRSESPYIVGNPETQAPYKNIFYAWDSIRKAAGLSDVRIHDLRHSFASFLINSGIDIYQVKEMLGHHQINTTMRYAHLNRSTIRNAANVVGSLLDSAMGTSAAKPEPPHRPVTLITPAPVEIAPKVGLAVLPRFAQTLGSAVGSVSLPPIAALPSAPISTADGAKSFDFSVVDGYRGHGAKSSLTHTLTIEFSNALANRNTPSTGLGEQISINGASNSGASLCGIQVITTGSSQPNASSEVQNDAQPNPLFMPWA